MGTPSWAVPSLRALIDSEHEVAAVVTNPDRPAGRGMRVQPSPVKEAALAAGIPVLQPERARDPELHERIADLAPEVAVVVAYGKILPGELLEVPPLGFVNVHFSLLPLYRGAAPVQRAVMEGRRETGVSIMMLTEGMDEGPVLATARAAIATDDTAGSVGDRLATIGAELLARTLPAHALGRLTPRPQDDALATYAPKITTDEARIDWSWPAERIRDQVRGLNPNPGAWTMVDDGRLKVWQVDMTGREDLRPGTLAANGGLCAGTGTEVVELLDVQLHGRRRMSGAELARGLRLEGTVSLR